MTYIVTDNCQRCKYTDCVEVCPVEAFHELELQLVINPETCIDCDACVAECPVEAIYADVDVPHDQEHQIEFNAVKSMEYPEIVERKDPLPGALTLEQIIEQRQ